MAFAHAESEETSSTRGPGPLEPTPAAESDFDYEQWLDRSPRVPTVVGVSVVGGAGAGKTTLLSSVGAVYDLDLGSASAPSAAVTTELSLGASVLLNLIASADLGPHAVQGILGDAVCAVLLVDTERLADSFAALDALEERGLPFVVAVNCFDGVGTHSLDDVRTALAIQADVPVLYTDARLPSAAHQIFAAAVSWALEAEPRADQ